MYMVLTLRLLPGCLNTDKEATYRVRGLSVVNGIASSNSLEMGRDITYSCYLCTLYVSYIYCYGNYKKCYGKEYLSSSYDDHVIMLCRISF